MDRYQSLQDGGIQPHTRRSWISISNSEGLDAHADAECRDDSRHGHRYQSQPQPQPQPQQQLHPDSRPDSHLHLTHQATNYIPTQFEDQSDHPPAYTPLIPTRTGSLNRSTNSVRGTSSNITPLSQLIKQRRRRCGGIFRPIEPGPGSGTGEGGHVGLEFEYEWPYNQYINSNRTDGTKVPNGAIGLNDSNSADIGNGLHRAVGSPAINGAGDETGEANSKGDGDRNANANATGRSGGRGRAWHSPNLTIEASAVNEMYFRTTQDGRDNNPKPPTPTRESRVEERGQNSIDDRRRTVGSYNFERDVEGVGARGAIGLAEIGARRSQIRSLADADADRKSTRSPSIYSQWSLESDQSGYNVIRKTYNESYLQKRRTINTSPPTATITTPQSRVEDENSIKQRIRNANESWIRLKQKSEVGRTDDKSFRSVLSRFGRSKRVAGGLGNRTQSMSERAREMFGSSKIPRRMGERVDGGGKGAGRQAETRGDDGARTLHSSEQGQLSEADGLTDQMANMRLDGGRQELPKVVRRL